MTGVRYTADDISKLKPFFRDQITRATDRTTVPTTHMEPSIGCKPLGTNENTPLDTPVYIVFTHYRHRLADEDGISDKACLDGLVRAGFLHDDRQAWVKGINHHQKQISLKEDEYTVIEMYKEP